MKEFGEKVDFLTLPDGQELFFRTVGPQNPKGVLILIHGLGEHSGRYHEFSQYLARHGWRVYLYDQRGHGKTPGLRAYVDTFGDLVEDLLTFIKHVKNQEPGKKLFLMGHSFGGQVAINFLAQHPREVKGAILSSPNIRLALQVPWIKRVLGRLVSNLLPSLSVPNDINPKDISHDQNVVRAYINDRLVYNKITIRLGAELLENLEHVMELAHKIKTPCLIFHGSADKVTSPEGSKDFFNNLHLKDRKLKIYPGFFHETLNEMGKERVYDDVHTWLEKRI